MSRRHHDRPVVHIHLHDDAQVVIDEGAEVFVQEHDDYGPEEVEYDHDPGEDLYDDE